MTSLSALVPVEAYDRLSVPVLQVLSREHQQADTRRPEVQAKLEELTLQNQDILLAVDVLDCLVTDFDTYDFFRLLVAEEETLQCQLAALIWEGVKVVPDKHLGAFLQWLLFFGEPPDLDGRTVFAVAVCVFADEVSAVQRTNVQHPDKNRLSSLDDFRQVFEVSCEVERRRVGSWGECRSTRRLLVDRTGKDWSSVIDPISFRRLAGETTPWVTEALAQLTVDQWVLLLNTLHIEAVKDPDNDVDAVAILRSITAI